MLSTRDEPWRLGGVGDAGCVGGDDDGLGVRAAMRNGGCVAALTLSLLLWSLIIGVGLLVWWILP
jgi:hypothetical protein